MAPSMASVPLLIKKQSWSSPGASSPKSWASAPRRGSKSSCELKGMRSSWDFTARTILGWLMPAE